MNGTGKSTLATAINLASTEEDLAILKPFCSDPEPYHQYTWLTTG